MRVSLQPDLCPALTKVYGPKDYTEFRSVLTEANRILIESGLEMAFIAMQYEKKFKHITKFRLKQKRLKWIQKGLRHCILLALTNLSYRDLAIRIADSDLFRWFVGAEKIDGARTYSKSTMERFSKMFDPEDVEQLIHDLNRIVMDEKSCEKIILNKKPLDFETCFSDTTCVKSNIHFPVDWVLLRDISLTALQAIILIRKQKVLNRMTSSPSDFKKRINKLCIEMTHSKRRVGSKSGQKFVFRKLRQLSKVIANHAVKHRDKLEKNWMKTELSKAEAQLIINRLNNVLEQLPTAIEQANERIVEERKVANQDKILSVYEKDVNVIVRGKANGEVEFGNGILLGEQEDGLIMDWKFFKKQPPADSKLVKEIDERTSKNYDGLKALVGDRGFHSKENSAYLEAENIYNGICPKPVDELQSRMKNDEKFSRLQTRRAATEARMAILKNNYFGKPLRSKGFENRKTRILWCIFSHNFWKISCMAHERRKEIAEQERKKSAA